MSEDNTLLKVLLFFRRNIVGQTFTVMKFTFMKEKEKMSYLFLRTKIFLI